MDAKSRREANLDAGKRKLEEFRKRKLEKQRLAKQALGEEPPAVKPVLEIAFVPETVPVPTLKIEELLPAEEQAPQNEASTSDVKIAPAIQEVPVQDVPTIIEPPTQSNLAAHLAAQTEPTDAPEAPIPEVVTEIPAAPEPVVKKEPEMDTPEVTELTHAEVVISADYQAVQAELAEVRAQLLAAQKEQASLEELRKRLDVTDAQKNTLAAELEQMSQQKLAETAELR
eukprot:CAMPEP_0118949748 /NCGR_PEP_ID=MMETSP1169-20130426/50186_1 /TAXON_ID=36882 /ORGANISM="Pyramimonas obovata, Strain CCMP722" /LENGTH=227 /DNA_ID=CAMNT_0006896441 /DNA_START=123 /DNA_END=802 /DNA_ORIENTATION=-